jgi:hypothetical protein
MKSYATVLGLAAFASTVAAHGYIKTPQPRMPGPAMEAACGKQAAQTLTSDINGNIQGILQTAPKQADYDAAKCNIWTCKGMQFDDNKDNVQSWTAGQKVPMTVNIAAPHTGVANISIIDTATNAIIGKPLLSWGVYASTARTAVANESTFDITIPSDLGSKCSTAGACTLQWWWDAREVDQTYEACVDFTVGGSGSGSGSTPASSAPSAPASKAAAASSIAAPVSSSAAPASSSAAPASSSAAPASSSKATVSSSPTKSMASATATPAPSSPAVPSQGGNSGRYTAEKVIELIKGSNTSNLPSDFTAEQFIQWFKQASAVKNARRAHPRAF